MRAKTKRVKMSSEKMAPFETVNFGRESICQFTDKCQKRVKAHACQIEVQNMIQSLLERERAREIAIHNPTL